MSRSGFTLEQLDTLEEVLHALTVCEDHFRLRDRANAHLHLAAPRYSPITRMVSKAARDLSTLLGGDQIASVPEDSEILGSEPVAELAGQTSEQS